MKSFFFPAMLPRKEKRGIAKAARWEMFQVYMKVVSESVWIRNEMEEFPHNYNLILQWESLQL